MEYRVKGSFWIEKGKQPFMGMGRLRLLEEIKKTGSIRLAAKNMKMSYRQAWEHIDSMNKIAKDPLVESNTGGIGGGGTRITDEGIKVIEWYKKIYQKFVVFNDVETALLNKVVTNKINK